MASLFSELFEGGSSGATVTSSNTNFASTGGTGLAFASTPTPPQGALGFQVTEAAGGLAFGTATITAATLVFFRLYVNPPATVTGSFDMVATRGSNSPRNRLRLNTDRTVSLLNGSAVVWTSTATVPAGQWSRIEVRVDATAGQQQARLYIGANPHTTTVTEDSSNHTYNQGTIDTLRFGQLNSSTTASTTITYDAIAVDGSTWPGPIITTPTISGTLTVSVTLTGAVTSASNSISGTLTVGVNLSGTVIPVIPLVPLAHPRPHQWAMFSRAVDYSLDLALPIISASAVLRHMGVSTALVTTTYTPARWQSVQPGCGIEVYRDGQQVFTGRMTARELNWDKASGTATIKIEAKGDEVSFADRPVFPDPSRAADDQIVNDYWQFTGVTSTAMLRLISDQAGPTCRPDRQITGLALGQDPAVGFSRTWKTAFSPFVLDQLALMSVSSGENLGLRMSTTTGGLTATIVQPRDLSDSVVFSADLSNLVGFTYREAAPDVTHALANGGGTLHSRVRKAAISASSLALQWGRQVWSLIDRSDTTSTADLMQAAQDGLDGGQPTVSLAVVLTDSQAATYGVDWDLGDAVTCYVGLPGQTKAAAVTDVVREIALTVDSTGKETITPAIGSYDATAVLPTPTQKQLQVVGQRLATLEARK